MFQVRELICIEGDLEGDPLKGINVDAAGGAGKVLKMLAEKVSPRIRVHGHQEADSKVKSRTSFSGHATTST